MPVQAARAKQDATSIGPTINLKARGSRDLLMLPLSSCAGDLGGPPVPLVAENVTTFGAHRARGGLNTVGQIRRAQGRRNGREIQEISPKCYPPRYPRIVNRLKDGIK